MSPVDPVPLRIALQKTSWRSSPTHRRSDSSGSSANSKDGHTELSPGRDQLDYHDYSRGGYGEHRSQEHYEDNNGSMYIRPIKLKLRFRSLPSHRIQYWMVDFIVPIALASRWHWRQQC